MSETEKRKCSTCGEIVWFGIEVLRPQPHSEGGELYHFGACIPDYLRKRINDEPSAEDKL